MKRDIAKTLPFPVSESLRSLGSNIRIARLKRGITADEMAAAIGIHRSTYGKLEKGDPMVAMGIYVNALFELGFGTPASEWADPRRDEIGQLLAIAHLPKRARGRKPTLARARHGNVQRPGGADADVLRVGVVGAMSGPYALWGLVSKYAAETTAEIYNSAGGVDIGGRKYQVEIVAIDDGLDARKAVAAARRLGSEGIRYVIGPNVEHTISSVTPVAERNGSMLFPYSFTRSHYLPPHENAVLGQIAGYQAWPVIFGYVRDHLNVGSISILAPDSPEGEMQKNEALTAAKRHGLRVLSSGGTYGADLKDSSTILGRIAREGPDMIVFSNLAPANAPRLMQNARLAGFRGLFASEAAQHIDALTDEAGDAAEGFFTLGGASPAETRSAYMDNFIFRYRKRAGTWHDEAGTKAYALELILGTLQMAGTKAIDDIGMFKKVIPSFSMPNPFVRGSHSLIYVGTPYFHQKRQIGVPMVINTVRNQRLETVLVGSVD